MPAEPRYRVYVHAEFVRVDPTGRAVQRRMWLIDDRMVIECGPVALGGKRLEFDSEDDAVAWLRHCVSVWAQSGIVDQQMYVPDDWWRAGRARWRAACRAAAQTR